MKIVNHCIVSSLMTSAIELLAVANAIEIARITEHGVYRLHPKHPVLCLASFLDCGRPAQSALP